MACGRPSRAANRVQTVALEVTPSLRAGGDRGLGRYTAAVREAAERLGYRVVPIALRHRSGRLSQFVDLVDRHRALTRCEFDVFHATNPYVTVVGAAGRTVTSILDVIPLDVPEYRETAIKARLFFKLAARAHHVLTISDFSAARIHEVLGVPRDRITVAPLPAARDFHSDQAGDDLAVTQRLPETPYFCAVADFRTRDPRKRLNWLGEIATQLGGRGYELVVVGHGSDAWRCAGASGLGSVTDRQLATVYRHARALVYTSAYEGQGLPPIEAMACGTPVVGMRNSAITEGVGEGGVLLREGDGQDGPQHLVDACLEFARSDELQEEMRTRALLASARFTTARFEAGIARAYGVTPDAGWPEHS